MPLYPDMSAFAQDAGSNSNSGLTKREYLIAQVAAAAFGKFGDETPDPQQVAKVASAVVNFTDAIVNAANTQG